MKKTVIFDIGGVLLDFDLPGLAAMAAQGNPDRIRALLSLRDHDSLRQVESGLISGEAYFEAFIRPVAPHWTFRDLIEGWKSVFSLNGVGMALLEQVRAKGARVCLLSNLADFNRVAIDEKFPGLFGRSDRNFFSYEMGCIKPDPVIFQRVLATIGAAPDHCTFLDDNPGNVASARNLGLNGIVFEKGRGAAMAAGLEAWMEA